MRAIVNKHINMYVVYNFLPFHVGLRRTF